MSIRKNLISIDIASAINTIVEVVLPRFTENKVLIVPIRISCENYNTNHRIDEVENLVFYRSSNYTFVGTQLNNERFFTDRLETELKRYSYHDSCWRYDGTSHIINSLADKILNECDQDDLENYSIYNSFNFEPKLIDGIVIIEDYDSGRNSKFIPKKK